MNEWWVALSFGQMHWHLEGLIWENHREAWPKGTMKTSSAVLGCLLWLRKEMLMEEGSQLFEVVQTRSTNYKYYTNTTFIVKVTILESCIWDIDWVYIGSYRWANNLIKINLILHSFKIFIRMIQEYKMLCKLSSVQELFIRQGSFKEKRKRILLR